MVPCDLLFPNRSVSQDYIKFVRLPELNDNAGLDIFQ